jgi:hypothetical protein
VNIEVIFTVISALNCRLGLLDACLIRLNGSQISSSFLMMVPGK